MQEVTNIDNITLLCQSQPGQPSSQQPCFFKYNLGRYWKLLPEQNKPPAYGTKENSGSHFFTDFALSLMS